ncbi:MAG: hypothetical protein ACYCR4_05595, partial [Acidimicrobiales bacterium]
RLMPTRPWRVWHEQTKTSAKAGGDDGVVLAYRQANVLLRRLAQLDGEPPEDSATFRRVMVAKRYRLWRVRAAEEDSPSVQVCFVVWFEADTAYLLVAGNKALLQELWYDAATAQAEAAVDAIRRRRQEGSEG